MSFGFILFTVSEEPRMLKKLKWHKKLLGFDVIIESASQK